MERGTSEIDHKTIPSAISAFDCVHAEPASFNGYGECFVESGGGKAGFGRGDFYAEPTPQIQLFKANRRWHIGKVMFEKNWFRRWF